MFKWYQLFPDDNDDDVDPQVEFLFCSNQTNQNVLLKLLGQQTVIKQCWAVFL